MCVNNNFMINNKTVGYELYYNKAVLTKFHYILAIKNNKK